VCAPAERLAAIITMLRDVPCPPEDWHDIIVNDRAKGGGDTEDFSRGSANVVLRLRLLSEVASPDR
jgi:hypothetical protein